MRAFGMASDLNFLRRRQLGVGLLHKPVELGLQTSDLVDDIGAVQFAKVGDPGFKLLDRLFKVERVHGSVT